MNLPRSRTKFIVICNTLAISSIFANATEYMRRASAGEFGIEDAILIPIVGYAVFIAIALIPFNIFLVWMTKNYPGPIDLKELSIASFRPLNSNLLALTWLLFAVLITIVSTAYGSYEMAVIFSPWIYLAFQVRLILACRSGMANL